MSATDGLQSTMREWLSGGAPPCQGGGRGFDSRLALSFILSPVDFYRGFYYLKTSSIPKTTYPFITQLKIIAHNEDRSLNKQIERILRQWIENNKEVEEYSAKL